MKGDHPLWQPSPRQIESANLTAFMRHVAQNGGPSLHHYAGLYDWSVNQPAAFWQAVWNFCGIISSRRGTAVLEHPQQMPGARWFPDARLNYAENLLQRDGDETAIVFRGRSVSANCDMKCHASHRHCVPPAFNRETVSPVICPTCRAR